MDTGKVYQDSDGNDCSIFSMVRREPYWAAVRVQEGEKAIAKVDRLEKINAELLEALEDIVACWDGPLYKHQMMPLISTARAAIANAKDHL